MDIETETVDIGTNTNPLNNIGLFNTKNKQKPHNISFKNFNPNEPKTNVNMKYSDKQNYRRYKTKIEPKLFSKIMVDDEEDLIAKIRKEFGIEDKTRKNYSEVETSGTPYYEKPDPIVGDEPDIVEMLNFDDDDLFDIDTKDFEDLTGEIAAGAAGAAGEAVAGEAEAAAGAAVAGEVEPVAVAAEAEKAGEAAAVAVAAEAEKAGEVEAVAVAAEAEKAAGEIGGAAAAAEEVEEVIDPAEIEAANEELLTTLTIAGLNRMKEDELISTAKELDKIALKYSFKYSGPKPKKPESILKRAKDIMNEIATMSKTAETSVVVEPK